MSGKRSLHTGIFAARPNQDFCIPDAHGFCATCSDEALPAIIQTIAADGWTAIVEISGRLAEVDISLVEAAAVGQVVLVHGGVAIGSLGAEVER